MDNVTKVACNWVEDISEFNEDFIKIYNDKSEEGDLPEVPVQHPKYLLNFHKDLPFLPERMQIE